MIRIFSIFAGSLIITLLLLPGLGKPLQKFETKIYLKITGKFQQHFEYDSSGVPYVVYQGKLGKQYNIVTIAEFAISLAEKSDSLQEIHFLNCINWLIKNRTKLNDSSFISPNNYDWPGYKMVAPWRSAMNQGRVMQAFIRAYEKTGDTLYLCYAGQAMNTLFTEVKDGGVTYKESSGYWYEEYADDSVPESRVLNGMIAVLEALSEFYKVTENPNAFFLFSKGVCNLKNSLHIYDNEGHSNYDALGKPASSWYHKFHIAQLEFLYNQTHEPIFREYKKKWELFKEPSYLTTLIQNPTRIGIWTVFTIFAGVLTLLVLLNQLISSRRIMRGKMLKL